MAEEPPKVGEISVRQGNNPSPFLEQLKEGFRVEIPFVLKYQYSTRIGPKVEFQKVLKLIRLDHLIGDLGVTESFPRIFKYLKEVGFPTICEKDHPFPPTPGEDGFLEEGLKVEEEFHFPPLLPVDIAGESKSTAFIADNDRTLLHV